MPQTNWVERLRQCGHRLTPQREMIIQVVNASEGHLTADEIIARVRKHYPHLNKSAVYRTLDLLIGLGLVNPTDLGQGCITYEAHRDPHHHHLICQRCGKIAQVDASIFASVERKLREEYAFAPCLDHFAIFGLCEKCQRTEIRGQRSEIRDQRTEISG